MCFFCGGNKQSFLAKPHNLRQMSGLIFFFARLTIVRMSFMFYPVRADIFYNGKGIHASHVFWNEWNVCVIKFPLGFQPIGMKSFGIDNIWIAHPFWPTFLCWCGVGVLDHNPISTQFHLFIMCFWNEPVLEFLTRQPCPTVWNQSPYYFRCAYSLLTVLTLPG